MTTYAADEEYALFDSVKAKFGALLGQFSDDDDLIDQTFQNLVINLDDGREVEVTKPPTASDAIQNAADHILSDPRIIVPPRPVKDGKDEANDIAERVQQFTQTWWHNVFVYCGDPLGRVKTPLVKGKGVLKKTLNFQYLPDLPVDATRAQKDKYKRDLEKAGRSTFMWNLEVIPKETVFEVGDPWDPDAIFEAYEITYLQARKKFPSVERLRTGDALSKVQYVEYWEKPEGSSKGKFIQWIDGERVHAAENPYCWEHALHTEAKPCYDGYIPYVIMEPGWGDTSKDMKPEERYVSIIRRSRSVIEAEAQFLTLMREFLKLYTFKPTVTKNIPHDKVIPLYPGAVWELQEGQEIGFADPGDLPLGILQGMQRVNGYVDQSAKLSALGGTAQRGVDTATEADQLMQSAGTRLNGCIRAMRRAITVINMQIQQDIEKVLEAPVTLYGAIGYDYSEVTLKPSEINGFYLTHVELDTSDEAALNLRNARTWSDLGQRLKLSQKTVMRMAGIMNGSQEMQDWLLEQIETSPQAVTALIQMAFPQAMLPPPTEGGGGGQQPNTPKPETIDQRARQEAQNAAPDRAYQ